MEQLDRARTVGRQVRRILKGLGLTFQEVKVTTNWRERERCYSIDVTPTPTYKEDYERARRALADVFGPESQSSDRHANWENTVPGIWLVVIGTHYDIKGSSFGVEVFERDIQD